MYIQRLTRLNDDENGRLVCIKYRCMYEVLFDRFVENLLQKR